MGLYKGFNSVGVTVFLICIGAGAVVSRLTNLPLMILAGACIGLYFLFAIVVVSQWEKVVVLRFGRYRGLRGPGFFMIIPIAATTSSPPRRLAHLRVSLHGDS